MGSKRARAILQAQRLRAGRAIWQERERKRQQEEQMVNNTRQTIGDQPIDPRYLEMMENVARTIDKIFNGDVRGAARKAGFVLLVFPFGENEGRCNYISNGANREDIVMLFKEQIKRFEGHAEASGHG